ncbi:hypothetical protein HZA75_06495 [Candidatus Roizmanbacteria bacterium]|nr:hypothetical protein [Candidatus Roizmanbacteria bacterium]
MLNSDIYAVIQWWLTIFLIGAGFLPLTINLFKSFFDQGYLFSKILGVIILSYLIFIFGLIHIISFSRPSAIIIFLIVTSLIWIFFNKKQNIITLLKQSWKTFIFEELFFLAALFFWAFIHSFSPDIHGLEKYMDYGFINSILRSDYFPPKDMWFTPYFINYYYFGHLITAVLTKVSGLPSNITFNLMLSTIFALCFTQSFSIAANLYTFLEGKFKFFRVKRIAAGIIGAILTTLAGNLHIIYGFFKAYPNDSPVPPWQLQFLPFTFPNGYWYPNATRFIYHTIHEFPIYSWVVADLHGHVLDIPIVLLIIAFLLSIFITKTQKIPTSKNKSQPKASLIGHWKIDIGSLLIISFLLSVAYMTNAWDGAIYLLLAALVITYLYSIKKNYQTIGMSLLTVIGGFILFTLPYNLNFKPFVGGIGVLCSPDFLVAKHQIGPLLFETDHCQHSPWWQLLILYGFFYFFIASFMLFISRAKKIFKTDQFILLLILLSTILIILPEFIYVKDIYPAHYRANTMFKLVFQAFIMLSLSSGYIIVRILTTTKKKLYAFCYSPFVIILISLVMIYPYMAINSYYGNLQTYHNLDGTSYLKVLYPADGKAIAWINNNIKGQPVILEAQGDSYTDYARVSTNTGLPTVLGWTVHEWLWRGTYDIPAPRIEEIKIIYETEDAKLAADLLKKYKIQYIFIGSLENEKYPKLSEDKFKKLGKLVFQKDNTKIYQITSL